MKKLILALFILLGLSSCVDNSKINIDSNNFNFTVIDTVYISKNSFDVILDYTVIIKIDTSYYGAIQDTDGRITQLTNKLTHIKEK